MTSTRPALVVAMHDGFYGYGTGAGLSNSAFLRVLGELLNPSVRLTVLPVRLVPDSAEYDPAWHRETLALIETVNGSVVALDNGTAGQTRFGSLENFRRASDRAAVEISNVLSRAAAPALAVAFDAPFFGTALALSKRHTARMVVVARATAALHAGADLDRIEWERLSLLATVRGGGRIAATSRHMRQHLNDTYNIPQSAIVDLVDGLTPGEKCPSPAPDDTGLVTPAAGDQFMLSYGRAEPYKGFEDLISALRILRREGVKVPHLVLGAVTEGLASTPYQRHLSDRITREGLSVTLHTAFTPALRGLLADPRLAAVIVPSRAEPFGRIPLEAYMAGASPVVATTAGGLAEIVSEGSTGYTAAPANPPALAGAISRALAATPAQRRHLLAAGQAVTRARYDYRANVAAFLADLAPWAVRDPQSA
jgi:glycosyltransferase involved in cell wall biosynthesis